MPTGANALPILTASDLLTKGLFNDRVIPPLSSSGLATAMREILEFAAQDGGTGARRGARQRSRGMRHSVPKQKLARRVLTVPNPRNQALLALEVEHHWAELAGLCQRSVVSLTTPVLSTSRALRGAYDHRSEGVERIKRSVGQRYMLRADFSRFYSSIYTHSIPWAIHGKAEARADRAYILYGNRLDLWVRETQDKQTGGLPVGPDTSFLLAEVIASAIDIELVQTLGELRGTRYIDDYHLYFPSAAEAERALAELHRIAGKFQIDINDLKTGIVDLPETIEPHWKTQLRTIFIGEEDYATPIKTAFDRAAELARDFPQISVFAYLVKKVESALLRIRLRESDWEVADALLLRAAVGEPAALPTVLRIFEKHERHPAKIDAALESICIHHASLQQANEVAWALWAAKQLAVTLSQDAANAIETVDDDIVALVGLDLHANGLLPTPRENFGAWAEHMTDDDLYGDHWLLAYEGIAQDWLPARNGLNYLLADPYFGLLHHHGVRFYDSTADAELMEIEYGDGAEIEDAEAGDTDADDAVVVVQTDDTIAIDWISGDAPF